MSAPTQTPAHARLVRVVRKLARHFEEHAQSFGYVVTAPGGAQAVERLGVLIRLADRVASNLATPAPAPVVCGAHLSFGVPGTEFVCSGTKPCLATPDCPMAKAAPPPREPDEAGDRDAVARALGLSEAVSQAIRELRESATRHGYDTRRAEMDPHEYHQHASGAQYDADCAEVALFTAIHEEARARAAAETREPDEAGVIHVDALYRMVYTHSRGNAIPDELAAFAPHAASLLNRARAAQGVPEVVRKAVIDARTTSAMRADEYEERGLPDVASAYRVDVAALDAWLATADDAAEGVE